MLLFTHGSKCKKIAVLVLCVSALMFSGFGCEKPIIRKAALQDYVDPTTGGKILEVSLEKDFIIKLSGDEKMGFRWVPKYDMDKIEFVRDEFVSPGGAPTHGTYLSYGGGEVIDEDGAHYFTFRAVRQGNSLIKFDLSRPLDTTPPPRSESYFVVIK